MNDNSLTTNQWLRQNELALAGAGIDSARLDCLVLLEDVTDKNRAHLLAHPELKLSGEQINALSQWVQRRITHEPLAYIRGKSEFYGRNFTVNSHVLVPRPESESFIELLNEYGDIPTIIDVGTGSGALAITTKLSRPAASVYAIDIDQNCLSVAKSNANAHGVNVTFLQGNLLRPLDVQLLTTPIALLANLPYVPESYAINDAAKHEPGLALFGGTDGLDLYRIMFDQLERFDEEEIIVFTEALESQHTNLLGIAVNHGFTLVKTSGLVQSFTRTPR